MDYLYNEAYDMMLQNIGDDVLPRNWLKNSFPINLEKVKTGKYKLSDWIEDFGKRMDLLNAWYQNGELPVFWMPLFFNPKLFRMNIISQFAKRNNLTPERGTLKFVLEDTYDESKLVRINESFYINGLILETCGFDPENKFLVKSDQPSKIPIVRIDYNKKKDKKEKLNESKISENVEEIIPQNIVTFPIYEKKLRDDFENVEAYGFIDFYFDDKINNYEYWISGGIKVTIDI